MNLRQIVTHPLALCLILFAATTLRAQDTYIRMDGPYGGELYDNAVAGDGTLYAITPNFDGYRSTNNGTTWEPLATVADDSTPQWIERVAVDSSGRLFIGGDFGVWHSTDRGVTFTRASSGLPEYFDVSKPSPQQIRLLEATKGGDLFVTYYWQGGDTVTYRSTDGGVTFAESSINGEISPSVFSLVATPEGALLVASPKGLHRSTDDGDTWTQSSLTIAAEDSSFTVYAGRSGDMLLQTKQTRELFRSSDDGRTWHAFTPTGLGTTPTLTSLTTTTSGTMLAVFSNTGYRSVDMGLNWATVAMPSPPQTFLAMPSGPVFASANDPMRSVDDGLNWDIRSEGLIATAVQRMVEGPDGVVYAGTSLKPFRSDDGGVTWAPIPAIDRNRRVRDLEVTADGTLWITIDNEGVYRSSDRGATWEPRNVGLTQLQVFDLEFDTDNRAYAATADGFHYSTDGGSTWINSSSGLDSRRLNVIAIAPDGSLIVGTVDAGISRSTDKGLTWTTSNTGVSHPTVQAIVVTSQGTVFMGGRGGIYRSLDNGQTWQMVARHHRTSEVRGLAESADGTIYAGSYYLARSTDNGLTWSTEIHVPFANYFLIPWVLQHSSGKLLFGTLGAGVGAIVPDSGSRWSRVSIDAPIATAAAGYLGDRYDIATSGGLYEAKRYGIGVTQKWELADEQIDGNPRVSAFAAMSQDGDHTQGGTVFAVTDAGLYRNDSYAKTGWVRLTEGLPTGAPTSIAVNNVENVVMLGTPSGMFRSMDGGDNWTPSSSGPTRGASTIVLSGAGSGYAFAAVEGDGVYRSDDWGWNWTRMSSGLPSQSVLSIAVSPRGVVYAGTAGAGVYRSTDNGTTWTQTSSLAGRSVTSLAMNSFGVLFAGTDGGVYRSLDGASTWARVNTDHNGMVNMVYDDGRGRVLALTDGGVFMTDVENGAVAGVEAAPKAVSESIVLAVAGNPLRDGSTVQIATSRGGVLRVALVDELGVERSVLSNGAVVPGEQSIRLDRNGLTSGVYLVTASIGDEMVATPVVVE
jgi:photosystem II stability/assembly factor-like uncharacterized protein